MMNTESWMDAHKAVELGFADGILYEEIQPKNNTVTATGYAFSRTAVMNSLLEKCVIEKPITDCVPYALLHKRIESIKKVGTFDHE